MGDTRGTADGVPTQLTTEHIKSHLQKFRQHHDRSHDGFFAHYEAHLRLDAAHARAEAQHGGVAAAAARESPASSAASEASSAARPPVGGAARAPADARELDQLRHVQGVQDRLVQNMHRLQDDLRADLREQAALQAEIDDLHAAMLGRGRSESRTSPGAHAPRARR